MTHDALRHDLALHAMGDLDENRQREIDAHLRTCADCRSELSELRSTLTELDALDEATRIPAELAELWGEPIAPRSHGRLLRVAAVFCIFALGFGAGGLWQQAKSAPTEDTPIVDRGADPRRQVVESAQRGVGISRGLLALKMIRSGG